MRIRSAALRQILLSLSVLLPLALLTSCQKAEREPKSRPLAVVGETAPDFRLRDTRGNETTLSSFRGKVVLLEFWATWCPPCKASVSELVGLQKRFGGGDFTVLAVSVDTGNNVASKVAAFSAEQGLNYPVLLGDDEVSRSYSVRSIPASFIIGKDGKIVSTYMGFSDSFGEALAGTIQGLI